MGPHRLLVQYTDKSTDTLVKLSVDDYVASKTVAMNYANETPGNHLTQNGYDDYIKL